MVQQQRYDEISQKKSELHLTRIISGWTASVGYVNAVNNLVLRASIAASQNDFDADWTEFKDPSKFGISVITHPMNFTEKQLGNRNM